MSSEEVARWCGVVMLEDALLRRRLGWFGHRDEWDALGRVWLVEVQIVSNRGSKQFK